MQNGGGGVLAPGGDAICRADAVIVLLYSGLMGLDLCICDSTICIIGAQNYSGKGAVSAFVMVTMVGRG